MSEHLTTSIPEYWRKVDKYNLVGTICNCGEIHLGVRSVCPDTLTTLSSTSPYELVIDEIIVGKDKENNYKP